MKGGETVNKRIKELRKILGITQQEFANKLGVSRNTVASYEIGKSNPSEAAINNICTKCQVNKKWLVEGIGDPFLKLDRKDEIIMWVTAALGEAPDSYQRRLIDALIKLDVKDWEILSNLAETLVKQKEKD